MKFAVTTTVNFLQPFSKIREFHALVCDAANDGKKPLITILKTIETSDGFRILSFFLLI